MLDSPEARLILSEVQAALKAGIAPGFQQRVAANAVALAQREAELAAPAEVAERERLAGLLGYDGAVADLNAALTRGIRDGTVEVAEPDLHRHLILTTVAKMEIDQPNYPAFRAWRSGLEKRP